jgi:flagellar hook-basal body complex protein FliE
MSIRALDALSAYANSAARAPVGAAAIGFEEGSASPASGSALGGVSFGALLEGGLQATAQAGRSAEVASAGAVTKTTDLVDVVTAVNNAEITLETVVAVRDRMISAYQEILRMPI